jgi:hypothetical protein
MEIISIEKLIEIAKNYSENNVHWHHHFLTPSCYFNKSKNFCIILENEDTNEVFQSNFKEKPMYELEQLENLFFNR